MDLSIKGLIADIMRGSTNDGPGIRTTVFLKGCNMRCAWCHNPETVNPFREWLLYPVKCIHCGLCAKGCYSGARVACGMERSVKEILDEVLLDSHYYGADGGLTISGGEPLFQAEFSEALLAAVRIKGIHTAIETNLSFPWETVSKVTGSCDLVMADMKLWDRERHKKWTGVYNDLIKENFKKLAEKGIPLIMRTPVVPGVNDSREEILCIASFAAELPSLLYYELLPYHPLGHSKGVIENGFTPTFFAETDSENIQKLASCAAAYKISVRTSGRVICDKKEI